MSEVIFDTLKSSNNIKIRNYGFFMTCKILIWDNQIKYFLKIAKNMAISSFKMVGY